MEHYTKQEQDRFNSFWEQVGECKLWNGHLDKDGYGSFYFRKKNRRAHRVAYYLQNGGIPDDLVIDHICRNRNCVESTHLKTVTKLENTMENSKSVGAINKAKTTCKFGHPYNRFYGKQRYCSICESEKTKRLRKKWLAEANLIKC